MSCRERLEAYLREEEVPFQTQHHPRVFTAQEVAAAEHIPGKMLAKVVMTVSGEKMNMFVLPAPYQVDLKKAREVLGDKEARLAEEKEFENTFSDCEVGAMPPFGNLYGLPVYVDESLTEDETIVLRAGTHTDTISLAYADFERLAEPAIVEFAHRN